MATRYVNTGSTAGGDGTTNNTSGSTRAYATRNEALTALGNLSEQTTIYCTGSTDDTVPCVQADLNFTTTAANYLSIIGERSPNHFSPTLNPSHMRIVLP